MEAIKRIVVKVLNLATVSYIKRNHIMVIAVAGSLGKTSTTSAIRTVLSQHYKVHQPKTTYNTNRSIHLEMFDMNFATSPLAWGWTVLRVLVKTLGKSKYQVIVLELGTDNPGELQSFAFLKPQIGVLTAIAPEHMERFKTLEAVAKEELSIVDFCDKLIFNADMVPVQFVPEGLVENLFWYGKGKEYCAQNYKMESKITTGADGNPRTEIKVRSGFTALSRPLGNMDLQILGEHSLNALEAAMVVGLQCDLDRRELTAGLQAVRPVKGRMQRLAGVSGSIIIDDSYNSSPSSVEAALDVLYELNAPQRIAVLGSMNEMGDHSPTMHEEVGDYCDPAKLDLIVTVGADANQYLAARAEARGCRVQRFESPYEVGAFVRSNMKPGAIMLFKGSQNGVFTEEAIKSVLADAADESRLVRQSDYWLKLKSEQFKAS